MSQVLRYVGASVLAVVTLGLALFGGWGLLVTLRDWVWGYAWHGLALSQGNIWFGVPWVVFVGTIWASVGMMMVVIVSWLTLLTEMALPRDDQPGWLAKKVRTVAELAEIFI